MTEITVLLTQDAASRIWEELKQATGIFLRELNGQKYWINSDKIHVLSLSAEPKAFDFTFFGELAE